MYKLNNISFSYTKPILENITLNIQKDKFYSIVGPNGVGKTTLLLLLAGLLKPKSGNILLENKPIDFYSKKQLAKKISLVSQERIFFDYTVYEIVSMGRYPHKKRFYFSIQDCIKIDQAIEICGLSHFKNESILKLSSGEYQRVLIARSLAQDTPILLLDEAFSNLDLKYILTILDALISLNKTIISVFHDLRLARLADYTIFLKNAKIYKIISKSEPISPVFLEQFYEIETSQFYNIKNFALI
ncbi:MAG: ABC transporter ATP-binding protein [Desulfurella sp.]|uniref:Iron complex transport system ATP-binding protein n=2 Tax=Desulfurella multipotens TaxID=79269 RepID=A0A1G6I552_9BACT|nr:MULTISPECIES: ABC transporter ATP-binding protein [Desulfurella]PMP88017.1 MAG: ABC transporter ATP-binding protein [Desulfurella sp.]SDC01165.1 iron complex transport system ATP-binding protein [Desulfurella multipotens]HEX13382.1 ABC transporter ATP-binding protein [Desulfurella acetivorans]